MTAPSDCGRERRSGFTKVPNRTISDRSLSIEARGFLVLLLSYAAGWKFRRAHLMRECAIGKDRYYRLVTELKAAGYLEIHRVRGVGGKFGAETEWVIRAEVFAAPMNGSVTGGEDRARRRHDLPDADLPDSGESTQVRKAQGRREEKPKADTLLGSGVEGTGTRSHRSGDTGEETTSASGRISLGIGFEDFWRAYPRPGDRTKSRRLFASAVKNGIDPEYIVDAAKKHAEKCRSDGTEQKFIAKSCNWLDRRGWEEFPPKPVARSEEEVLDFYADAVKSDTFLPSSMISARMASALVRSNRVSLEDLRRKGIPI